MTPPIRAVPDSVARWISRMWWLRCADAVVAWVCLWSGSVSILAPAFGRRAAVLSVSPLDLGVMLRPVRVRWRPVSGWVGLAVRRGLHPGDRAWYARARVADLVSLAGRDGSRL